MNGYGGYGSILDALSNRGALSFRDLVVAHANGEKPGGKNYRLVRQFIAEDRLVEIGPDLFLA